MHPSELLGCKPKEALAQTLQGGWDSALSVTGLATRALQLSSSWSPGRSDIHVFTDARDMLIPTLTVVQYPETSGGSCFGVQKAGVLSAGGFLVNNRGLVVFPVWV